MTRDVRKVVDAHIAAFNARDLEAITATFTDDAVFATGDTVVVGRGVRQLFAEAFTVPAELRLEVLSAVVDGDTAACELRETIAHEGMTHEFHLAGFYTARRGALVRVKVYREGSAEMPPELGGGGDR